MAPMRQLEIQAATVREQPRPVHREKKLRDACRKNSERRIETTVSCVRRSCRWNSHNEQGTHLKQIY